MTDIQVTRTTSVLRIQKQATASVQYVHVDAGDTDRIRILEIDRATFREMGSPTLVTVTIDPGDLLNDDPAQVTVDSEGYPGPDAPSLNDYEKLGVAPPPSHPELKGGSA